MLMIVGVLVLLGLALGSFVNALVWRVHLQYKSSAKNKKPNKELSVIHGRSMCPTCKHTLQPIDLVPVLSWLSTRGKCRYCSKPISKQYPAVEILTALLFVASYYSWPHAITGAQTVAFGLWLLALTGLMALLVYDLRWMLLPNRIMAPLAAIAGLFAATNILSSPKPLTALVNVLLAVAVGGGLFYVLFQVSSGKWIGGGDVKLGWVLGLIVGTPARALLLIFLASVLGTLISLPLLASKRLQRQSTIPFGPLLIVASVIVLLFGNAILRWYQVNFFPYNI